MPRRLFPVTSRLTLVQRVILGFAILIGLVSLLYSVALVYTIEYVESTLVGDIMREKITLMEAELSWGRTPFQTGEISLYGDSPKLRPIPPQYADAPTGYSEYVGEPASFLFKRVTDDGHTLLLVFDQAAFEQTELEVHRMVTVSFCVVLLIATLADVWLGRLVVNPIRRLSKRVSTLMNAKTYQPMSIDFADDEVGRLAQACDRTMERLFKAIERERAFTSDVSHELRTPLTVLRTSAECLELGDLNDRQRAHLERIFRVIDEMQELLEIFLALARQSQTSDGMTDEVTPVLERAAEVWTLAAREKGLALTLRSEGRVPGTYSPVLLGVVVTNLVKNAILYTEKGEVVITETNEGFSVRDTGPGITEEEQKRIYEKFFRGVSSAGHEGSGVGLSVVKRIADRCGWRVAIESSPEGTCLTVTLTGAKVKRMDERG